MEENEEQDSFRVNWLAVFAVVIGLVLVGVLMGKLSAASSQGGNLECPSADQVQMVQSGDHVLVFCEN